MGNGDIAKGVDKVNQYCRQNSYVNTKLEGEFEQENTEGNDQTYTSVNDVATILEKIFKGTCVNRRIFRKNDEFIKRTVNYRYDTINYNRCRSSK